MDDIIIPEISVIGPDFYQVRGLSVPGDFTGAFNFRLASFGDRSEDTGYCPSSLRPLRSKLLIIDAWVIQMRGGDGAFVLTVGFKGSGVAQRTAQIEAVMSEFFNIELLH